MDGGGSSSSEEEGQWTEVCSLSFLARTHRRFEVQGRLIALFWHQREGRVFALDANCYHAGGPLEHSQGDIEDINSQPCIRCPLHNYVISISTGESFYQPVERFEKEENGRLVPIVRPWTSKAAKQRTHRTKIKDGMVYVSPSLAGDFASDSYASCTKQSNRIPRLAYGP